MKARLAAQRLLAERPQGVMTPEIVEELRTVVEAVQKNTRLNSRGGDQIQMIGPVLKDSEGRNQQMIMLMEDGYIPVNPSQLSIRDAIGVIPGKSGTLSGMGFGTSRVSNMGFGWVDPGGPPGEFNPVRYRPSRDPRLVEQIRDIDYATLLKEGQLELMDRVGLSADDLLQNQPVGASNGDFRRAKSYMMQGFGAVDKADGTQYARITGDGSLAPVQLFSPDPDIMESLNWTVNNEAVRRAQQKLEAGQTKTGLYPF